MFEDFMIRAGLAGLGVALAAGPLGCFVVWRRIAYFGDATAHAAILGVALAFWAAVPVFFGALVAALGMAAAVAGLTGRGQGSDTLLGVFSHSALALGLVAASLQPTLRMDLSAYLFGDVLAVGWGDLGVIWAGAGAVLGLLLWRWRALLTATLSEDLAIASGGRPGRERLVLTLALALVVAVALQVVGVLLIAAMLLIPAASARPFSRSPEAMAVLATLIGGVSALGGLGLSYVADTPAGPSMVAAAAGFFTLSQIVRAIRG